MSKPAFILSMLSIALSSVLTSSASAQGIDFGRDIWPIIEMNCVSCHGPDKQKGDLRFDDLEWLTDEELTGPGSPKDSIIFELISLPGDHDDVMPPKNGPLSHAEITLIRLWIEGGAKSEGWEVPEIDMDQIKAAGAAKAAKGKDAPKESAAVTLAKGVQPAPADALKALEDKGALAIPLAQNNNLLRVDFNLAGDKITDAEMPLLDAVSNHVTWLSLGNTKVTDAGMAKVAGLPNLTRLHLENTQITDASMAHIAKLQHLEYLNLFNTPVTDAGLKQLSGLKNLKKVFVWQSKVSADGAKALTAAIPGIQVNTGIALAAAKPAVDLSSKFTKDSCCAKAHAAGKKCDHACCVEAAGKNEVCTKCNKPAAPAKVDLSKGFTKDSCCAKAHAGGKACTHPCCVEAAKGSKVCTKCNKSAA